RVVLTAGALSTPAILLRSGIRNRLLGRGLYLHPATAVSAVYDEPVRSWEGAPMSVYSPEFSELDGNYGVYLETVPGHPGLIALATPWDGAGRHRGHMRDAEHMADLLVLSRDRIGGRLTVDRDGRARVDYRISRETERHLRTGLDAAVDVAFAGGAMAAMTLMERPLL
ncbi:glucose-methanol-choline oxidoreductase, partial [mine drainage metagenome]